jgi:hypothetical protein
MIIQYYHSPYGTNIVQSQISTDAAYYISHDDRTVTFKDSWVAEDDFETHYHEVTHCRIFSDIRNREVKKYNDLIKEFQAEVAVLESSDDYDVYRKNLASLFHK